MQIDNLFEAIACMNQNRKFVGYELNPVVFDIAMNRVVSYRTQEEDSQEDKKNKLKK